MMKDTTPKVLELLTGLAARLSSRKFLITLFVIFWATRHPEMELEQAIALLGAAGIFNWVEGKTDIARVNGKN